MTVQIYKSTDASAPVLSGTAGSLITLLDACLVDGYGAKTAAGWTKPYSGTNLAVYRMSTVGSSGCYLRVDDSGTSPDARTTRLLGYKTMSDVNTGTGQFPTNIQLSATTLTSGGGTINKSSTAAATARPWVLVADERLFYFICGSNSTTALWLVDATTNSGFAFGDINSNLAGDTNQCVLLSNSGSYAQSNETQYLGYQITSYSSNAYFYIAKDYTGLTVSKPVSQYTRYPYTCTVPSNIIGGSTSGVYPDPVTGGINLFSIGVAEGATLFRGLMPGWYYPWGGSNIGNIGDEFAGTGTLAGKNFIFLPVSYAGSANGRVAVQFDGDWRA